MRAGYEHGYEMEDDVRREMLQAMSELVDKFGGASHMSQNLFILNQMPPLLGARLGRGCRLW